MKVSLNWLKEFTDINLSAEDLAEKITTQLGAVEQVTDLGKQYEGIIVVKVIDSQPHPNADKLHVCKIDDGNKVQSIERDENGYIQIVCGAPNVRKDLLSVYIPPGTVVPDTLDHDPLTVEVREIRGEKSHGMLASYRELAISNDHNGIVELSPADGQPGDSFADVFKLEDYIIDLENKMFTHRPDCFGQLGIAREIAGICHQPFKSPDWYSQPARLMAEKGSDLPLVVENQLPELVSRFMAVALTVKDNGPSPIWLQSYLSRVGIRPVNTIVDITNYMMMVSAQPLHAYDYDKLKDQDGDKASVASLIVRSPKADEQITALNDKTYTPKESAIGIASATKLVGIGGIIGGAETEVDNSTKHLVLECANFDMYSIRRTAMENGIFTDAVIRYTKGQSPLQNGRVLNETVAMLQRLLAAKISSEIIDLVSPGVPLAADTMHPPVTVTLAAVKRLLGLELAASDIVTLLKNVEFKVTESGGDTIQVTAPFWRTDIEIAEDVIEEIGRLWGYDALPLGLPKRDIKPALVDRLLETKSTLRKLLSAAGANELLTYSFVHGQLMKKTGQDSTKAFQLRNAISPDLQYYRLSLLPSLLEKVYPNIRAGHKDFAIFEINPVHSTEWVDSESKLPVESQRLGLVFATDNKFALNNYHGAAYFQVKKYLNYLLAAYGVKATFEKFPSVGDLGSFGEASSVYEPARSAVIRTDDNPVIGLVGEFKNSVKTGLKLPDFAAGFEIDILCLSKIQARQSVYQKLSRFPSVQKDICLRTASTVAYSELYSVITKTLAENPDNSLWYEVLPVDIYQAADSQDVKQFTFHITVGSYQRTLTDSVAEGLLADIVAAAAKACGATQV